MKVIEINVLDVSGLGGPSLVDIKFCSNMTKALRWAEKYIKENYPDSFPTNWSKLSAVAKEELLEDFEPVNFTFRRLDID